jgi:hypothetical protein
MTDPKRDRWVIVRDLIIFQIKLLLEGLKDIVVSQISIGAAALDLLFPTANRGARFYAVMRAAERFDNWLSLYGATEKASANEDGLFGVSRAGSDSLLGKLEELVLGRKEGAAAEADQSQQRRAAA